MFKTRNKQLIVVHCIYCVNCKVLDIFYSSHICSKDSFFKDNLLSNFSCVWSTCIILIYSNMLFARLKVSHLSLLYKHQRHTVDNTCICIMCVYFKRRHASKENFGLFSHVYGLPVLFLYFYVICKAQSFTAFFVRQTSKTYCLHLHLQIDYFNYPLV